MMTRYGCIGVLVLLTGLSGGASGTAGAQDAQSVKLGEAALRFAGGSIQQTIPQDGIVNFITGDNQITGNRMVLGWGGSDVLYLRLGPTESAAPGDLYTVYRRVHKVFHPRTGDYLGYLVNRLAVVRVLDVAQHLATVQIVRSFSAISPGDAVVRFTPPVPDELEPDGEPSADMEGMIVDLQSDKAMSLVGQGNLVYLDRGRADGLRAGDHLQVDRIGGGLPARHIAKIRILSVEDHTATAMITRSAARVLRGDRVQFLERQTSESPQSAQGELLMPNRPAMAAEAGSSSAKPGEAQTRIHAVPIRGGMRISLDDLVEQLEYESGHVTVKPAGMPVLVQIADYLKTASSSQLVRIEGHADNMEIGPSLKSRYASNWELSRARAATIMRYLVENGGIDSAKLSAVGYGSSRPVATNATDAGRKQNRRVEIVLYTSDPDSARSDTTDPLPHITRRAAVSEQAAVRVAPLPLGLQPEFSQSGDAPAMPQSAGGLAEGAPSQASASTNSAEPPATPVSEPAAPASAQ